MRCLVAVLLCLIAIPAWAEEKPDPPPQDGVASYYGRGFHGRKTANGERFNKHELTAASKTLPLGTKVEVTNKETGESVDVRINDRGPYVKGRTIDLSEGAAKEIGMKRQGVARVEIDPKPE